MIAALALAATATSLIAGRAEPWMEQDRALIGRLLAAPSPPCASDGVRVSGERVTGATLYRHMTGFAQSAGTGGGLARPLITVNRPDDPPGEAPAGTLRWAVARANTGGGGWIAFTPALRGATIRLRAPLRLASNITLDGGCAMPRLVGAGRGSVIYLRGSRNIVITRLSFEHLGAGKDGDCITVSHGADRVWLAYLRLRRCRDGLIDVTRDDAGGAMRVTISNNRFADHDKAMLVVGAPLAAPCTALKNPVRLTVAHNIFYHTGQRHPRASGDALVHLSDNIIAFTPQRRADSSAGGAYGTLAADGARIGVERTLYLPPAGGRKYRLLADRAAPSDGPAGACGHGFVTVRGDAGKDAAARHAFIRSVIGATEPPAS